VGREARRGRPGEGHRPRWGVGEERAKKIAVAFDVRNVEFHEPVPPHEMAEAYASADFSLVTGKDLPNFRVTIPAQFHNSLVAGLPVVTTMQDDIGGLVEDLGLGCVAETEDPESLARVMRRVAVLSPADDEELRLHVCDTYRRKFSVQSGLDSIDDALLQAVGSRQL
jgi:colanic acid biosynthesis glycosyl transferase WcaI